MQGPTDVTVRTVRKCLECSEPQIAETLTLVSAPCGCDVELCPRCVRAPMTSEWIKHFANAHSKFCQPDPMIELSA